MDGAKPMTSVFYDVIPLEAVRGSSNVPTEGHFWRFLGNLSTSNQTLYVSGGEDEDDIMVTRFAVLSALDIISNQEEADTKFVLHACAAANSGAKVTVVCSPDTDVLLLLLHHWPTINKEVYFLTAKGGKYTIQSLDTFPSTYWTTLSPSFNTVYFSHFTVSLAVIQSVYFWQRPEEGLQPHGEECSSSVWTLCQRQPHPWRIPDLNSCEVCLQTVWGHQVWLTKWTLLSESRGRHTCKENTPTRDSFMSHLQLAMYQLYTSGNMPTFQLSICPQLRNLVMKSLKMEYWHLEWWHSKKQYQNYSML